MLPLGAICHHFILFFKGRSITASSKHVLLPACCKEPEGLCPERTSLLPSAAPAPTACLERGSVCQQCLMLCRECSSAGHMAKPTVGVCSAGMSSKFLWVRSDIWKWKACIDVTKARLMFRRLEGLC